MKLPANNLNYPIRILVGNRFGSGFLIRHGQDMYLVTAKHVLYRKDELTNDLVFLNEIIRLVCYPLIAAGTAQTPRIYEINLETIQIDENIKPHPSVDIVVLKMGTVIDVEGQPSRLNIENGITVAQESEGMLISYDMQASRRFDDVEITNDVFVLGYPATLSTEEMQQIDYNSPLVRKGIVAGKNQTTRSIILDCPVYGGNSGGLVLEMNETGLGAGNIHLIGVVVQFVPFVDQWQNVRFPELFNTSLQNSGYSVALPVDYIYELVDEIEAA